MKYSTLHLDSSKAVTGAFKSLIRNAIETKEEQEHIFILPKNAQTRYFRLNDTKFPVYELPVLELRKSVKALLLYFPMLLINSYRVYQIAKKHRVQIVHANDFYILIPYLVKYLWRYPCIIMVHGRLLKHSYLQLLHGCYVYMHKKWADIIYVVSEAVEKEWGPHPKLFISYNVDPPLHDCPEQNYEVLIKTRPFRFVYIANYIQGKGQEFAIEAFKRVVDKYPCAILEFYGNDMGLEKNKRYKMNLESRVKALNLENNIRFNGFSSKVEPIYRGAHVCLMFSESESFSLITFESLCYGTPVIATDCGGPSEMIEHRVNGLLVENRNTEEMTHAMIELIENEALCITMHKNSKTAMYDKLDKNNQHQESLVYLNTLLEKLR